MQRWVVALLSYQSFEEDSFKNENKSLLKGYKDHVRLIASNMMSEIHIWQSKLNNNRCDLVDGIQCNNSPNFDEEGESRKLKGESENNGSAISLKLSSSNYGGLKERSVNGVNIDNISSNMNISIFSAKNDKDINKIHETLSKDPKKKSRPRPKPKQETAYEVNMFFQKLANQDTSSNINILAKKDKYDINKTHEKMLKDPKRKPRPRPKQETTSEVDMFFQELANQDTLSNSQRMSHDRDFISNNQVMINTSTSDLDVGEASVGGENM